jgi:hypothetical protein
MLGSIDNTSTGIVAGNIQSYTACSVRPQGATINGTQASLVSPATVLVTDTGNLLPGDNVWEDGVQLANAVITAVREDGVTKSLVIEGFASTHTFTNGVRITSDTRPVALASTARGGVTVANPFATDGTGVFSVFAETNKDGNPKYDFVAIKAASPTRLANDVLPGGVVPAIQTVASAATITLPSPEPESRRIECLISGTANITSITATPALSGVTAVLIFTGTAGGTGLTDGSNLKLSANLVYTPDDTCTLVCDGTNWYETGRAVN